MNLRQESVFRPVDWLLTVVLAILGAAAAIAGSEIEAGPELWIDGPDNVEPGTSRNFPDVAVDNNGRRIHVWIAYGEVSRGDVFLRRFDAEGNPLEDPRLVNTTTDRDQWTTKVAAASDGSFLVIFDSYEEGPSGAYQDVVRSQAYDADGNTVGNEQLLSANPIPGRLDVEAEVVALRAADGSAGGYVVVWASLNSSGSDTSWGLEAIMVSSTGVPGAQFQVPSDPPGSQQDPSVTELADGGFLVAWTEASQVWGRRFNAAGGPVGNDFVISTSFVAQKLNTSAAIGWDGRVLVVWADQEDTGTNAREIYARLYDADLVPLGPDFRVNTVLDDDQSEPRVADLGPKGFLVLWQSQVSSGADLTGSIEARVVAGPNEFGSPQTQFNIWDDGAGQGAMGAHGWYGRAASNWRTPTIEIAPGNVQNDDAILGRDVEHCIFCSDFDWFDPGGSGSLWRWAASVGADP